MRFIIVFMFILIFGTAFSQVSFSHSVGVASFLGTRNASSFSIGAMYSPRLNFLKVGENSNLSIGTHVALAFNLSDRSVSNYTYHLPLVLEYNFGHASSNSHYENKSGGYFGFGYSFDSTQRNINFAYTTYTVEETLQGPIVNVGMRFKIAGKSTGIRLSYVYGTGNLEGGYMTSFGIQYNLGVK